jgi:hypothetical protein
MDSTLNMSFKPLIAKPLIIKPGIPRQWSIWLFSTTLDSAQLTQSALRSLLNVQLRIIARFPKSRELDARIPQPSLG